MKRKIPPVSRQRIKQEDIFLDTPEKDNQLYLKVKLSNLKAYFPSDAKIIIEAYNRVQIQHIPLNSVGDYKEELKEEKLNFATPLKSKLNFRVKIIDPQTYKLLGFAENLKAQKYAKSLLSINFTDDVENLYQIDFENKQHPMVNFNIKLKEAIEKIKPFIAEAVFKEILNFLIYSNDDDLILAEHKWFKFAHNIKNIDWQNSNEEEKLEWKKTVISKFSKQEKIVDKLIKGIE